MVAKLEPGQYIYTWHETVVSSHHQQHDQSYFRVIRVTPHTVVLKWQHDDKPFRKSREWVEANFEACEGWHPEIKI